MGSRNMRSDSQLAKVWYGTIFGALAVLLASLWLVSSESETEIGDSWLTSLREQGL